MKCWICEKHIVDDDFAMPNKHGGISHNRCVIFKELRGDQK